MKCKNCGVKLFHGEKFCYNCGIEVKNTYNFCVNCGARIEPGDRYCSNCGQAIEEGLTVEEERIVKRGSYPVSHKKDDKILKVIFYGSVAFALIFLLFYFYTTEGVRKQNRVSGVSEIKVPSEVESKVYEVASKFICGCGQCGDLSLDICNCPDAIREKNFIKEQLMRGETIENVIVAVNQTYGNIKPEFDGKFGTKLELKLK